MTKYLNKYLDVYLVNFKSTGRFCQIFVAFLVNLNFSRGGDAFTCVAAPTEPEIIFSLCNL